MKTFSEETIVSLSDELIEAEKSRKAIGKITEKYPELRIDDAYKIQIHGIEKKVNQGDKITGKKIGLTSIAMQKSLGVDQPDFGFLLESMEVKDGTIDKDVLISPRVEGELGFVLDKTIDKNMSIEEIYESVAYIVPMIEIVDSRIENWNIALADTISDNASCGKYMLASEKFKPDEHNWLDLKLEIYKNGEFINEGFGKDVLGDPAIAVRWLAEYLDKFDISLNKGDIILSGAFSAAVPATSEDIFVCKFGDLCKMELRFK